MNYLILKNIVETTLAQFICKECNSKVTEQNIQILGTAGNALNMEIMCPQCQNTGVVKAEINVIGPGMNGAGVVEQIKKIAGEYRKGQSINDADIVKLREDLKKGSSVQDIFNS